MTLEELLQRLAHGPIGDLSVGGDGSGEIPFAHVPKMFIKVQQALTALHTRFPLHLRQIRLEVVDGVFTYPLRAEYALTSGSPQVNKFIADTMADPFTGGVLAVERIFDEQRLEIGLNQRGDATSWHTSSFDTLHMDYPVSGDVYFVEYRADHPKLVLPPVSNLVPENPEDPPSPSYYVTSNIAINIPPALEMALLDRVAYEIYCGMTSDTAGMKTQELMAKFELECQQLQAWNTLNDSVVDVSFDSITRGNWG